MFIITFLMCSGVCSLCICYIFISENINAFGYVIIILFLVGFGGIAFQNCYGLFTFQIRQKIILTEDFIQIKAFYILPCLNKNAIYNYLNLKKFKVEKEKVTSEDGDSILYHIP